MENRNGYDRINATYTAEQRVRPITMPQVRNIASMREYLHERYHEGHIINYQSSSDSVEIISDRRRTEEIVNYLTRLEMIDSIEVIRTDRTLYERLEQDDTLLV